jgi:molybdenum cofactor synthesis domain-containing protein
MSTAGLLIIGNEILSGKVVDENSPFLCREMRELGVDVERILTISDEVELIAREVRAMSNAYDYVVTSGGIGPTHDDVTIEGIAQAFDRPIELNESIAARLRRASNGEPNESAMKMAMIPQGASLLDAGDMWFPLVVIENVFVFPGIPELLRKKFTSSRERFRGIPFEVRRVFVTLHESEIVADLNSLLEEFPDLLLGSYPKIGESAFRVLLTLESRDADYLQRALASLLGRLSTDCVHKVE